MVVNDAPAGLRLPEEQGEGAVRLVVRTFQTPAAQHQRGVFAQDINFQIRKCERAHDFARAVPLLVTIEDLLPAARDAVAANKLCFGRTVVSIHVAFDVAAIPGCGLGFDDCTNGGLF